MFVARWLATRSSPKASEGCEPKVGEFEPDAVLAPTDIGHAEMTRSHRGGSCGNEFRECKTL